MFSLQLPRHIPTLPTAEMTAADRYGRLLGYCGRRCSAIGMVAREEVAGRPGRTLDGRPKRLARVRGGGPSHASSEARSAGHRAAAEAGKRRSRRRQFIAYS
jgi:hypothetical protein